MVYRLNLEFYGNLVYHVYMEHDYEDLVVEHADVVVVRELLVVHKDRVYSRKLLMPRMNLKGFQKTQTSSSWWWTWRTGCAEAATPWAVDRAELRQGRRGAR